MFKKLALSLLILGIIGCNKYETVGSYKFGEQVKTKQIEGIVLSSYEDKHGDICCELLIDKDGKKEIVYVGEHILELSEDKSVCPAKD